MESGRLFPALVDDSRDARKPQDGERKVRRAYRAELRPTSLHGACPLPVTGLCFGCAFSVSLGEPIVTLNALVDTALAARGSRIWRCTGASENFL